MARAPARRRALLAALSLAACTLTVLVHRDASERRRTFPPEGDLVYLPRVSAIRAAALGHTELAADLLFIRTLAYFSSQLVSTRDYAWLDAHLDAVNALDPRFRTPYLFASRATMYNGRTITNREVESSSHFLEAGLTQFPDDWELAFALGCNYLFELKTADPAQRERWRHTGAAWIRRAATHGGPPWLANLAATVMSQEGEQEAALRYLEESYLTAPDDRAREEIGRLLEAKRRGMRALLAVAEQRFRAGWRRALPYAPPDLYVLVGDPNPPRLDPHFWARDSLVDEPEEERR